jgi:hypothetical protein
VTFSDFAFDNLVSQDLSKLSQCGAPEVTRGFSESKHWVSDFVLNSAFRFPLPPERKQFGFFFLRRAQAAFIEYDYAREALAEYVATLPQRKTSLYFRALHHFEITIAMLWQAYEAVRKLTGIDLFKPGDNSRYERLNQVYNHSRYSSPELPPDHLHRVRISNTGIHTAKYSLTFEELQEALEEIGRLADRISSGGESEEEKSPDVSEKT